MKQRSQMKWLKLTKRALEQIKMTDKNDVEAYNRLKKKAEKYLNKAKALEQN